MELNCLLHGNYIGDEANKNRCPKCVKEKNSTHKLESQEKPNEKMNFGSLQDVEINCETHGVVKLKVHSFMVNHVHKCNLCIDEKRKAKIEKSMIKHTSKMYESSNIPENFRGFRFKDVDRSKDERQTKLIERLVAYVTDIVEKGHSDGAKNILLSGNMGTGKTLFASILLQNIIQRSFENGIKDKDDIKTRGGLSCQFISEQELLNSVTATWNKGSYDTTKKLFDGLSRKAILCIDDVGTISSMQTHLLDAYALILDERYKRKLPTIITSNLTLDGLKLAVGVRATDRFLEKNRIIVANFDWGGYRTAKANAGEIEIF